MRKLKIIWFRLVTLIKKDDKTKKIAFMTKISARTYIEDNVRVHKFVELYNSSIGRGTYIGERSKLNNVKIGRFSSIAQGVEIISGRHPTNKFVSTHPSFFSNMKQAGFSFTDTKKFAENQTADGKYSVIIGSDVWLGTKVMIMEGVKVGDGAIVGAGAIVTKDLEPYGIYVGVPAKLVKYRFEKEEIKFLIAYKWWNKDFLWIKENSELFDNVENFIINFNK